MSQALTTKVKQWVASPISPEVARSVGRIAALEDVHAIALMPDVHLAEDVCIGAVVATTAGVYPDAVGSDIGCGMACMRLRGGPDLLSEEQARRILEALRSGVPANRQRHRQSLPEEWSEPILSTPALQRVLDHDGRIQLGTIGRGNHFVELQIDDDAAYWLMVHTGSRALGPAIRQHHASRVDRSGPIASGACVQGRVRGSSPSLRRAQRRCGACQAPHLDWLANAPKAGLRWTRHSKHQTQ